MARVSPVRGGVCACGRGASPGVAARDRHVRSGRHRAPASARGGVPVQADEDSGPDWRDPGLPCPGLTFDDEALTEETVLGWVADEGDVLVDWGHIPESWPHEGTTSGTADDGAGYSWGESEGCEDGYVWLLLRVDAATWRFLILGDKNAIRIAPGTTYSDYAGKPILTRVKVEQYQRDAHAPKDNDGVGANFELGYEVSYWRHVPRCGLFPAGSTGFHLRGAGTSRCPQNAQSSVATRVRTRVVDRVGTRVGGGMVSDDFPGTSTCAEFAAVLEASFAQGLRALASNTALSGLEGGLYPHEDIVGLPRAVYLLSESNLVAGPESWFRGWCRTYSGLPC